MFLLMPTHLPCLLCWLHNAPYSFLRTASAPSVSTNSLIYFPSQYLSFNLLTNVKMAHLIPVPLSHILPLFIGTSVTLACTPAYFDQAKAIRMFGLPERIATSPTAYSPWILYSSRIQATGMMILIFYAKGNYEAVDTVLSFIGFFGVVDIWVCMREGVRDKAWQRGLMSAVVGMYGLLGWTSGS
jgi:hypothetical protein